MYSGQNDPQMLEDLATKLAADYPGKPINLGGHSNGGFMAQRMWLERPTLFSRFACASGPQSAVFGGAVPTDALLRPMLSMIGGKDATLSVYNGPAGSGSHFLDYTWTQPSTGYSVANVQIPHPGYYMGEFEQFKRRANAWGLSRGLPNNRGVYFGFKELKIKIGLQETYYTADKKQVLMLIKEAGHFILGRPDLGGPSMQECMGKRFFNVAMAFFNL